MTDSSDSDTNSDSGSSQTSTRSKGQPVKVTERKIVPSIVERKLKLRQ